MMETFGRHSAGEVGLTCVGAAAAAAAAGTPGVGDAAWAVD